MTGANAVKSGRRTGLANGADGVTTPSKGTSGEGTTALGRLAGVCYDRRRTVLVIWILAIIGMTVLAQMVGTHFENKFTAGNTPSQQALNILQERFPSKSGDTADVVFQTTRTVRRRS